MTKTKICSICQEHYIGFGNNAWPINSGRCCDVCNDIHVIPARLADMRTTEIRLEATDLAEQLYDALVKSDKEHAVKLFNDIFALTKSNKVALYSELFK